MCSSDLLMEYRGDEIVIGGVSERLAIPAALEGETIILEQRNGIRLKNLTRLKADRLELLSNRNVSIQTSGTILAELIVIRAQGTEDVEATVYDPANGGTRTIMQPTGSLRIEVSQFNADTWDVRARRDILLDIAATTGINTVTGYLGGLTDNVPATSLTWRSKQTLQLQSATLSAQTVVLEGKTISAGSTAKVIGDRMEVTATGSITLNTRLQTLVAVSTTSGNITILEDDDLLLERIYAENGTITARARGTMTARSVVGQTDGTGKDITLIANGILYVDYVDAGRSAGLQRSGSKVTLRSKRYVAEPVGRVDNVVSSDSTMVDVTAWQIKVQQDESMTPATLIKSEADRGYTNELEVLYTAQSDGISYSKNENVTVPTFVAGDYVLYAPDYTADKIGRAHV